MSHTLACPRCGEDLKLPDGSEGKQAQCPACQHVFMVPHGTQPPSQSAVVGEEFNPYQSPTTRQADLPVHRSSDADRQGLPWESEGKSLRSYLKTVRWVLLSPQHAYRSMRRRDGIGNPLLYALAGGSLGGLLGGLSMGVLQFFLMQNVPNAVGVTWMVIVSSILGGIVWGIVGQLLGSFISAGLIHLMLLILGSQREFETTFRVVAYTGGSTALLQLIPQLGALIALVWNVAVEIIGIAEAHELPYGRAATAVVVPLATCCLAVTGLALGVFGFAFVAQSPAGP